MSAFGPCKVFVDRVIDADPALGFQDAEYRCRQGFADGVPDMIVIFIHAGVFLVHNSALVHHDKALDARPLMDYRLIQRHLSRRRFHLDFPDAVIGRRRQFPHRPRAPHDINRMHVFPMQVVIDVFINVPETFPGVKDRVRRKHGAIAITFLSRMAVFGRGDRQQVIGNGGILFPAGNCHHARQQYCQCGNGHDFAFNRRNRCLHFHRYSSSSIVGQAASCLRSALVTPSES